MIDNPAAWWIHQLHEAVAFEQLAWRAGAIAMAEPIPVIGSDELLGLLALGGLRRCYRCHRWVDGRACIELPPDVDRSQRVGMIVAALARLHVNGGSTADQLPRNALDAYDDTVAEAETKRMDWAPALADLRPYVTTLQSDFVALADKALPMAIMHRDIDPKNASVREDNEVVLFDWDYAGPRVIASELLAAALSFAGGPTRADERCVLTSVNAYLDTGGALVDFNDAAPILIEEGFRWIMLNAWRCLGHRSVSPEEQAVSGSLVRSLAPQWPEVAIATRSWAQRLVDDIA